MGGAGGGAGGGEVMYTSGSEDIYQSIVLSEDTAGTGDTGSSSHACAVLDTRGRTCHTSVTWSVHSR